jgi:hypothetical protein
MTQSGAANLRHGAPTMRKKSFSRQKSRQTARRYRENRLTVALLQQPVEITH